MSGTAGTAGERTRVRRCWAEVDLAAIRHNVAAVREHLGPAVGIMAVVKANAYGHGVGPVAKTLRDRVECYGVANVTEARELRSHVPEVPIVLLGAALPDERAEVVASEFEPTISSLEEATAYAALAGSRRVRLHLKIDTGMGRMGVQEEEALCVADAIRELKGVQVVGIATHLPSADEDDDYTREELTRFAHLISELRAKGFADVVTHAANSAGVIGFAADAGGLVRPGLMLYGSAPRPEFQERLRPALTWKTRIVLVREVAAGRALSYGRTFIAERPMRVATLGVGYADGYQRHLSGRGSEVLIAGHRCAVLGRVTMDQILADVTDLPRAEPGDEVVLLGAQGGESISAADLAQKAGTIPWEIFTGLGPRVERCYQGL